MTGSTSAINNIREKLPLLPQKDEFSQDILKHHNVRIERIVSFGQASDKDFWYDQEENEWVILLEGSASLEFPNEEEEVNLQPGDYIFIPAHRKHRVKSTALDKRSIWLAVFF